MAGEYRPQGGYSGWLARASLLGEVQVSTKATAKSRRVPNPDPRPPKAKRREPEGRTPSERAAWGRSVRDEVARGTLRGWQAAHERPDPVALLLSQSAVRVPDLVPIRHGRMLVSPFTFYRGAALVMAADLARTPSSGIFVQACGDAHLSNFGAFATPERTMAFDINDFDETHPAPFEWDVARFAASIVVAADDIGFDHTTGRDLAQQAVARYREQVRELAGARLLDIWYSRIDLSGRVRQLRAVYTKSERRRLDATVQKAQRKTNVGALDRLAERVDGRWQIKEHPPLITRETITPARHARLREFFSQYLDSLPGDLQLFLRHYELVDFARKVVGVGSVGTEAHIALLIGAHGDDPLFLQMKEADDSVLQRYTTAEGFKHQGQRVVFGQRVMQAVSDIFLGWASAEPGGRTRHDFYVRQLYDYKTSFDVPRMTARRLSNYAEVCSEALARAHARSGMATAIAGYLGRRTAFDKAMSSFAVAYADQNRRDYEAFAEAAAAGQMEVSREV